MTREDFFNMALSLLGERKYVEGSPTKSLCDMWFRQVMMEALSYGRWSFAMMELSLALDAQGKAELPNDCIKLIAVDCERFRLVGRKVCCLDGHDKVEIRYISNNLAFAATLPDTLPPLFVEALTYLMASKVATPIGSSEMAVGFMQIYKNKVARALTDDVRQWASNDQEPRGLKRGGYRF